MAIDPLLRRSVGFPLRHPLWAVAVAVSVACLALASATPQLVPAAARQNAFEGEVRVADAAKGVGHGLDARAYTTGLGDAAVVAAVTSELDRLDLYGVPIVSVWPTLPYSDVSDPLPVARTSGGAESVAVIVGRDDVVRALGDTGGGGLWLPEQVARDLGVTAGDAIQLSLDYPSTPDAGDATVDAIVAGSYAGAAPGAAVVTLPTDPTDGGSADVFFADTATALKVLDGLGDRSFVKWDLIWDAPVSIEDGRDAAAATRKMASALQDPETTAGRRVAEADAPPVVLSSKVAGFVTRSDEAAAALVPLVSSIARSAQLVALMALMGSLWLSIRSRRRDAALALSTGTGPIRSVVLALVELLVPLSVATAVSIAVLRWAPSVVIGEGAISPGLRADGQRMVLGAVAAAVAALGAVAWFAAWSAEPASRGTAHRLASAVRLDTVAIVAAVVTGAQLATTSGPLLESGTSLLFPLFVLVAAATVLLHLGRGLRRLVAKARRERRAAPLHRPRSTVLWMWRRRVDASLTELGAVLVAVTAGVGLFAYCGSIAYSGATGVSDKTAAAGGAAATVAIASTDGLHLGVDGLPDDLGSGRAVVWSGGNLHLGPDLASDLLVIDPSTFAAAATWRESFAGMPIAELLAELGAEDAGALDVIIAGNYNDDFGDSGRLELSLARGGVPYEIVARIPAAPWQRSRASMALVSAESLVRLLMPTAPLDEDGEPPSTAAILDKLLRTYVWSSGSQAELEASLESVRLDDEVPNTTSSTREPSLVAFGLSMPYLRAVGDAMLAIAAVAIIVSGTRQRGALALELVIGGRMGIRPRAVAASLIGASLATAAVATAAGLAGARLLVGWLVPRIDPGPEFAPRFAGQLSTSSIVGGISVVIGASLFGVLLQFRGATSTPTSEVLRGAD